MEGAAGGRLAGPEGRRTEVHGVGDEAREAEIADGVRYEARLGGPYHRTGLLLHKYVGTYIADGTVPYVQYMYRSVES